jgi:hypothetical protein
MEFFRTLDALLSAEQLQEKLTVGNLAHMCDSIDSVLWSEGEQGEIYCLWGQFPVSRQAVNGGVRFTLPTCPNALQWTVTAGFPPKPDGTVLHATINRTSHDPDFVESIDMVLDDWVSGLMELAR